MKRLIRSFVPLVLITPGIATAGAELPPGGTWSAGFSTDPTMGAVEYP